MEDNTVMAKYKKVLFVEDFFVAIKEVHEKLLLHAGYHKTYEKVLLLAMQFLQLSTLLHA